MIPIDLEGQVALVTGASRGIGLGVARALSEAGAIVHLLADDPAVHDAALGLATELGRPCGGHEADITDRGTLARVLDVVGPLDILVNNAGLERLTPLADPDPDSERVFRRVLEINVTGTALVTRLSLPRLRQGARIVSTASIWGRVAEPEFGAYVASKHAVIGLTRTWARELAPRGIRVNAVCPGWVRTEASLRSLKLMAERSGRGEPELLAEILAHQALPGLMEPRDVAGAYLFLVSPLAASITGQAIVVDRGEVMA
jgi:3-hydroxybutyrate dehydrogenase